MKKVKNMDTAPTITMTPELVQQFESELCWCIQQLKLSLKSDKLNSKQVESNMKSLNVLMNNSTSIVKKRQVMRVLFGDYRAKMAEEEKKFSKVHSKVTIKPAEANKNSLFLKKAVTSNPSDFKFNFGLVNDENVTEKLSNVKIMDEEKKKDQLMNKFTFIPSKNDFQFNFNETKTS